MVQRMARPEATGGVEAAAPALWTLQRQLAACPDLRSMLGVLGDLLPAVAPVADRVSLALVEDDGEALRFYRLLPALPELPASAPRVRIEGTAVGAVARDGQPRVVADTRDSDGMRFGHASHAAIRSTVSVPVRIAGRVVGVLNAGSAQVNGCAPWMIEALAEVAMAIGPWLVAAEAVHRQLAGDAPHPASVVTPVPFADAASGPLVAQSPAMANLLALARRAAASDAPLLITGEAATGKAALARAIHAWSRRAEGSLRRSDLRNSAALDSDAAFAEELRSARCGTWLLLGIDALPPAAQAALVRALDDGGTAGVNARIVATSRVELSVAAAAGHFRRDLLDRLEVLTLRMPPLRARAADLPALAGDVLARLSALHGRCYRLSLEGQAALQARPWPGNLRELESALARAAIAEGVEALSLRSLAAAGAAPTHAVEADPVEPDADDAGTGQNVAGDAGCHSDPFGRVGARWAPFDDAVGAGHGAEQGRSLRGGSEWPSRDEHERRYLLRVLAHTGGRIEGEGGAAHLLGLEPSTLRSRARRLGIDWNLERAQLRRRP